MRLLLDTHVLIWSFSEPDRLGPKARKVFADLSNDIFLSPLSIWEMLRAHEKRKIDLGVDPRARIATMLIAAQAIEASFTHDVAMAALRVELSHRDPMDRLLAATASHYGLTLVTSDLQLLNGKGFQTIRADR